MSIAYLSHGQEVFISNKSYQIERHIDKEIQLIEANSKRVIQMPYEKFLSKLVDREIQFETKGSSYIPAHIANKKGERISAMLEFYPKDLVNDMKIKRTFVESYLKIYGDTRSQKIIAKSITELWNLTWGKPPHPASIARWIKRYIEAGRDIRALCKAHFLKGNRVQRFDDIVINYCQAAINNVYLKPERGSIKLALEQASRNINQENRLRTEDSQLPLPTKTFISSLIHELPEYDVYAARYGKSAAQHKFRNAVNSVYTSRPLERVEVDHTRLDMIVVDAVTGIPIGRPWLTLVIDHYSKCILGFNLSFDSPSHMTVARALMMALQPKVNINKRWPSIRGEWNMFGLMQNLVADNGLEFHGMSLEDACLMMGINISYCPRKKGWWKATVERAIGNTNRSANDGLPGRTYSSNKEKADYKAEKKAILPLEVLEEIIAKWIVDIYHETMHETLGKKPSSVWREEIDLAEIPIVTNLDELDAVFGIVSKRDLTHKGIQINNLFYNSNELGLIREKFSDLKDITVKWNPEDLGYIFVLPPDGTSLKVQAIPIYKDYVVGMSFHKHEFIKKFAKDHLNEKNEEITLLEAKAMLQDLSEKAANQVTKNKRRFAQTLRKQSLVKSLHVAKQEKQPITVALPSYEMEDIPKFEVRRSNRQNIEGVQYE